MNAINNRFKVCNENGNMVASRGFRKHYEALAAAREATRRSRGELYVVDTMAKIGACNLMRIVAGGVDDFFPVREAQSGTTCAL